MVFKFKSFVTKRSGVINTSAIQGHPKPSIIFLHLLAALLAMITASMAQLAEANDRHLNVVTSISPLADMVANIGGNRVSVKHFIPLDVDPHTYEPTFSSLAAISKAQIAFLNGDGLDRQAANTLISVKPANCRIFELSEFIPKSAKNRIDPHYWLDPQLAKVYVQAIADLLSQADVSGRDYYQSNAYRYGKQIEELDHHFQKACSIIPSSHRNIILYHNSWTYLVTRYGFNPVAIIESSRSHEPSARQLAHIITKARSAGVQAILSEAGHAAKILQALKDEAHIPVVLPMVEDSLNQYPYNTYLGMMQANLDKLAHMPCDSLPPKR